MASNERLVHSLLQRDRILEDMYSRHWWTVIITLLVSVTSNYLPIFTLNMESWSSRNEAISRVTGRSRKSPQLRVRFKVFNTTWQTCDLKLRALMKRPGRLICHFIPPLASLSLKSTMLLVAFTVELPQDGRLLAITCAKIGRKMLTLLVILRLSEWGLESPEIRGILFFLLVSLFINYKRIKPWFPYIGAYMQFTICSPVVPTGRWVNLHFGETQCFKFATGKIFCYRSHIKFDFMADFGGAPRNTVKVGCRNCTWNTEYEFHW